MFFLVLRRKQAENDDIQSQTNSNSSFYSLKILSMFFVNQSFFLYDFFLIKKKLINANKKGIKFWFLASIFK